MLFELKDKDPCL